MMQIHDTHEKKNLNTILPQYTLYMIVQETSRIYIKFSQKNFYSKNLEKNEISGLTIGSVCAIIYERS